jgi:hypothetical protein
MKAEGKFKIKDLSGDLLAENLDREVKNMKLKVHTALPVLGQLSESDVHLSSLPHA